MGILYAILALGGVYYLYSSGALGSMGAAVDTRGGWTPVKNATPLNLAQLDGYNKPGVAVKFYIEHPHPSGSAVLPPKALAYGTVAKVETGKDGVRYWTVKLTNASVAALPDGTVVALPAGVAIPPVGTEFALKDDYLFG